MLIRSHLCSKWAAVTTMGLSIMGCAGNAGHYTIPRSTPVPAQDEAGTVLIAPTMVAPWDEVSAALKPAFTLTGDQAVAKVLPTTESINEQIINAFGASLAAGLPTTSTTSTTTVGGTQPGTTSTTEKKAGSAPTLTNALPSGVAAPSAPSTGATLGTDPVLMYRAATYLLEEVQLLNQEIDNAASQSCYVPYVVKLKLAVMNFRPRLPYSAHAHIGFSYNGALASNTRLSASGPMPPQPSHELAPECQLGGLNPEVVPLLVADDMQVALRSQAAEAAQQLAFGLSALIHGAGISANVGSLQGSLTAISNHDLTSTLTVGRESESSLYALITPSNQASDQASLVSQTYDVAVLLLVPRFYFSGADDPQSPTIAVTTFTEYRNASSGKPLPRATAAALIDKANQIIPKHLTPPGITVWNRLGDDQKAFETNRLVTAVKTGSAGALMDLVSCKSPAVESDSHERSSMLCDINGQSLFTKEFRPYMWAEMASFLDYDTVKLALFQAPLPTPIKVPSQQFVLNDDGSNPIQAVVGAVSARWSAKLAGFLEVTPFDVKSWKKLPPVTIAAQGLALDTTAHTLTLTFPSLKKLNITCLAPADIPPRPANPEMAASGEQPRTPDCPVGVGGAGTFDQPNAIDLRLVGCDPSKQLCPALTDTSFANEDGKDWLARKVNWFFDAQQLALRDIQAMPEGSQGRLALEARHQSIAKVTTLLRAAAVKIDKEKQAQAALAKEVPAKKATLQAALDDVREKREEAWEAVQKAAIAANLKEFIDDHAALGVSLYASPQSNSVAKAILSNFGKTIPYDSSGTGQLVLTLTPTPATDTISIKVDGASLKSITDDSGVSIAFDAKHGFVLPKAGVYTLNLTSLNGKYPVNLTAQLLKGDNNDGQPTIQPFQPTPPDQKPDPKSDKSAPK